MSLRSSHCFTRRIALKVFANFVAGDCTQQATAAAGRYVPRNAALLRQPHMGVSQRFSPYESRLCPDKAQVDYGTGPMVLDPETRKYRRTRLFVMTLGCSRKAVRLLTFRSSARARCFGASSLPSTKAS
jgi:hypothetical protein